jgi:hypothetical protein
MNHTETDMKVVCQDNCLLRVIVLIPLLCSMFHFSGCMRHKPDERVFVIPFQDFSVMKYYRNDNGNLLLEFFYGNSSVWIVGLDTTVQVEGNLKTVTVSMRGGVFDDIKRSGYSRVSTEVIENGHDVITVSKLFDATHQLIVNYRDDSGLHQVEYAGTLSQPLKPYVIPKKPANF